MLRFYGDVGPWNELFVQDQESGPVLIYRPCPFVRISAPYTTDTSTRPATVAVSGAELVDLEVNRADGGVANYYWVDSEWMNYAGNGALLSQLNALNGGKQSIGSYPNAAGDLYGFRLMRVTSEQGPRFDVQKAAAYQGGLQTTLGMLAAKAAQLIAQNQDNVVFETGHFEIRGREDLKAGSYVTLQRGGSPAAPGFTQSMYAHSVTHEFLPYRSWKTSVQFDRGTGFIARAQRAGGADSPYLSEMSPGGVYG